MSGYMPPSATVEWPTPQHVYDTLDAEFGFDLDAAASHENAKTFLYYTKEQDGLTKPWGPYTVWVNPPYGRGIADWMSYAHTEAREHGATVVLLVPVRSDTAWWHDYAMRADEIRLVRGRLKFGEADTAAPFPVCVIVFKRDGDDSPPLISSVSYKGGQHAPA